MSNIKSRNSSRFSKSSTADFRTVTSIWGTNANDNHFHVIKMISGRGNAFFLLLPNVHNVYLDGITNGALQDVCLCVSLHVCVGACSAILFIIQVAILVATVVQPAFVTMYIGTYCMSTYSRLQAA